MEQNSIYHLIILDESGSMASIAKQAISGLNETLGGIRAAKREQPEHNHFVSIVSFEGDGVRGVKTIRERIPIEKIEGIAMSEYHPGGCTPLYDAMGLSINRLIGAIPEGSIALVTVITDGMENSSEVYSGKVVKDLVSRQREKGWTFAYIGANQDAVEVANELGIHNALNFHATPEGTEEMAEILRNSTVRFSIRPNRQMLDAMDFFTEKPQWKKR